MDLKRFFIEVPGLPDIIEKSKAGENQRRKAMGLKSFI
jgi:hypothetical protein